ncbi:MAG: glycogen synthase GlgA [Vampirovibrionia bacterium]
MLKKLNILIVASEVVPFAKAGGLADVAGALPKELSRMGHDVRVVMPRYYIVDKDKYNLKPVGGPLGVPMGVIGEMWCGVMEGRMPDCDVPIYFIDHESYFGRKELYTDDSGDGYMDNDNRFVFFSRASLELCKMINFKPDVINVNDWHTSVVPVLLNTAYRHDPFLSEAGTLLTIHNMQHQGNFYEGLMDVLGIGWENFNFLSLEKDNQVNLLKGGIYHSTLINTVSDSYAKEMHTAEFGWGLEGVIQDRSGDVFGILNGIDYDIWNPETDPHIKQNFSVDDLSGKVECKKDLQRIFGLPERPDVPVIGLVTRLVKQKGVDVLAETIHRLLRYDLQIVLLGSGEVWSHFYFGDVAHQFKDKFAAYFGYNNTLAHIIEAGSDFFLMPSRFEPCGLNQMYSLSYGTLPIVRATGGLNDTIENFNEQTLQGTGFKFYSLDSDSLYNTVGWAIYTYYHKKDVMDILVKRAMERRFTWEGSARSYEELYYETAKRRLGHDKFNERFKQPACVNQ